jgi:hypothetical protein
MPLLPTTLQSIQRAGQSLHVARKQVHGEIAAHSERLVTLMASQPYAADADRAYTQLRQVARLAHELQSLEEQLGQLYHSAGQLAGEDDSAVLEAPAGHHGLASLPPAQEVEEVQPREVRPRRARPPKAAKAAPTPGEAPASNESKVLAFLKTRLDRRRWTALSQGDMARGAGIPAGSIGAVLRRLQQDGRLVQGGRGRYKLG